MSEGGEKNIRASNHQVRDASDQLVFGNLENRDGITGLPFEAPGVRSRLIGVVEEAMESRGKLVFVFFDLDNLKGINDMFGYEGTNDRIGQFFLKKREALGGLEGIKTIYYWRPHAGGDEFNALIVLDDNLEEETAEKEISGVLEEGVNFESENMANTFWMTCSASVTIKDFAKGGDKTAGEVFREMEAINEMKTAEKKTEKIMAELEKTMISGAEMTPEEFIEMVAENWGTRRPTSQVLGMLLWQVAAKFNKRMLMQR